MNKKGFTLVELLGVLVILSLLVLVSIPIVNNIVKNSQKQIHESNIDTILDAAYEWSLDEDMNVILPEDENDSIIVTLDTLKKSGHLKKVVVNAKTGENYSDTCSIIITKKRYNKNEAEANKNDPNKKYYNNYLYDFSC